MEISSIVIGHGSFGRDVLRRLLLNAASRGVLSWKDSSGGEAVGRSLRNLGLIWIDSEAAGEAGGDAPPDMIEDLYRQILRAEGGRGPSLQEAVRLKTEELLRASTRAAQGGGSLNPLMLNVIVVARPDSQEAVGKLKGAMAPVMKELAAKANLKSPVEGSDPLNFVLLLDFPGFWELDPMVRRAVTGFVEYWREQEPGFSRIYLSDRDNADGVRDDAHRLDELVLFLELLLFESGQGPLQFLFRRSGKPALSTFGVRLVEQNGGLLVRLAAARFGREWVKCLREGPDEEGAGLESLDRLLSAYQTRAMGELLDEPDLRAFLDGRCRALAEEAAASEPRIDRGWSERVSLHCQRGMETIREELLERAGERLEKAQSERLQPLPERLRAEIDGALHHPDKPACLNSVTERLQAAEQSLRTAAVPSVRPGVDAGDWWRGLRSAEADFLRQRARQIDPDGFGLRWPWVFGAMAAAGFSPLMARAVESLGPPDPASHHLWRATVSALNWLSQPFWMFLLLFAVIALAFRFGFKRSIAARIDWANRVYSDRERGRCAALLRKLLASGGALRNSIDAQLDQILQDFGYSIRGHVGSEIRRASGRLSERGRELQWLQRQLSEFLRIHGIHEGIRREASEPLEGADPGPVRRSLQTWGQLQDLMRHNPPVPARFRSVQSELRPFAGWNQRFDDTFLAPLPFLDRLTPYFDGPPTDWDTKRGGEAGGLNHLPSALAEQARFNVAFRWKGAREADVVEKYVLLPPAWRNSRRVEEALSEQGFDASRFRNGVEPDRAYLLRLQSAVASDQLGGD